MAKLAIKNLTISINNVLLLKNLTLTAIAGEIFALVGNNGSGKSTFLKTIAGLIKSKNQHIFINDQDINALSIEERAAKISLLLQHAPEQPYCTGRSRVTHGLMPFLGYDFFYDEHIDDEVFRISQRLNIEHLLDRRLLQMSGGEQRLVQLARCLVNPRQSIVLLDEPSVYLDRTQKNNLIEILKQEAHLGRIIIFSSHDEKFIENLATKTLTINDKSLTF